MKMAVSSRSKSCDESHAFPHRVTWLRRVTSFSRLCHQHRRHRILLLVAILGINAAPASWVRIFATNKTFLNIDKTGHVSPAILCWRFLRQQSFTALSKVSRSRSNVSRHLFEIAHPPALSPLGTISSSCSPGESSESTIFSFMSPRSST